MKITEKKNPSNLKTIFIVALTCIFLGGFIGASTNMINGIISPFYFKVVLHWEFNEIWIAIVCQGIFEGLLYGIVFSFIFTTGFGIITKGQAPISFAHKQLLKIIAIIFSCWVIGGLLAIILATLSPDFYKSHFPYSPIEKTEMLKFAWVGGSIWGEMIGGIFSAILGVVLTKNSWSKELELSK
jgi:hypothetical protein